MKQELRFGPAVIRLDFLLVVAIAAVIASPLLAICLAVAITAHELGHALARRWLGGEFRPLLQLSGGRPYVRDLEGQAKRSIVLLAGPLTSGVLVVIGARVTRVEGWTEVGYDLFYASLVWTGFQLAPFPPTDGGQLLRMLLEGRIKSATLLWRLSWFFGLAWVALVLVLDRAFLIPAIWLTGMAVILARAEAGYVRHLDAWSAWEKGDHREVIRRARTVPEYLDRRDKQPLIALGITSALELADQAALEELAPKLPPYHPSVIEAATSLLMREKSFGARLAERAFDALDAEQIKKTEIDRDRWSEMAFRLAVYEANNLRPDSALGVLERAIDLGYAHKERIEAEPAFARLIEQPRWKSLLEQLG